MPAGHVLVALFIGLVVAALLNAQGMHKQALSQGPGIGRDIAGTLTAGLAGVSGILQIDQPRRLLKAALGRSGDDKLVGKLAITAKGPAAPAAPTKPVYSAAKPMGLYLTGDSLITDPGPVLLDKISTNPAIKALGVTDAHAATGLVQPEVFNWFDYLPQQIKALKPNMTVATFGANDGLGFTGVTGAEEFGTPAWLAAYLSPNSGSLFPLVPWSAFVLAGAALGQIYARWGAAHHVRYANRALLIPGVVLIITALWLTEHQVALFGTTPHSYVPGNILLRAGASLLIVGLIAHASRGIGQLPHVFGAVAQESLLIYVLHLGIVYGSVWAPGLLNIYGVTLTPWQLLPIVIGLIATMTLAAYSWNWLKHTHRTVAWWTMTAVVSGMIVRLL